VALADASAAEFAERIKAAIAAWLRRSGLVPRLRVLDPAARSDVQGGDALDEGCFTLPLVDGLLLEIADEGAGHTLMRWDAVKADLFPYAHEQVTAFRTCRAARAGKPLAFASRRSEKALRGVLEAAWAQLPLVLSGESGTGKTELAAIYAGRDAGRARGKTDGGPPFITVHCALLDQPLAHSVLFGALKGSYTSAERSITGAVELADGGVLFLDDVDALSLETQAKLLRFLDHGEYEPLGHGKREPLHAEVRVVAGTNADLRAAVKERRFREDLYWRLHSGAVVQVPPLRERPEDVDEVLRGAPGAARPGGPGQPAGLSVRDRLEPAALDFLLRRHSWRGNFRECLRFCARVRLEPDVRALLGRARCEQILAEAGLDQEPQRALVAGGGAAGAKSTFDAALEESLAAWLAAGHRQPESFDELQRFCESYLKSVFVAHALGLAQARERPASFDKEARQRLGCDLSTLKRKLDDYLSLGRPPAPGERG
jgi:DNA-binding NtrC family response regulator